MDDILSSIGDIDIYDSTQFWVYTVSGKSWGELEFMFNAKSVYHLASYDSFQVSCKDVVLIYIKGTKENGFIGVTQICSNIIDNGNSKINVYKDKNLNRYCIKLDQIALFDSAVKLSTLSDSVLNVKKIGSLASFRGKYTSGNAKFHKLDYSVGIAVLEKLYEITDDGNGQKAKDGKEEDVDKEVEEPDDVQEEEQIDEEQQVEDDETNENEDNENEDNENEDDETNEIDDDETNEIDDDETNEIEDDDETNENDDDETDEESKEDESEEDESEETEENNKPSKETAIMGNIPIMIVPCKKFKIPKINGPERIDYVISHYKSCANCDITNNGGSELGSIIDSAEISYTKTDPEDDDLAEVLNAYHSLEKYNSLGSKIKSPHIKIYHIYEKDDLYHNCLLVEWTRTQQEIDTVKKKKTVIVPAKKTVTVPAKRK
jgi:hypothetical protein